MIVWSIVAGVIGGIVAGMGMGGGTLIIPILTIFLSYSQIDAQGINLIAFLPMSVIAIIIHATHHLVDFKDSWLLALVGVVFSLAGAWLANNISTGVLKKLFAVFLIGLGIWQLIELILQIKRDKKLKSKKVNQINPQKEWIVFRQVHLISWCDWQQYLPFRILIFVPVLVGLFVSNLTNLFEWFLPFLICCKQNYLQQMMI